MKPADISDLPADIIVDVYLYYVRGYDMRAVCKTWCGFIDDTAQRLRRSDSFWPRRNEWRRYVRLPLEIAGACERIWSKKPPWLHVSAFDDSALAPLPPFNALSVFPTVTSLDVDIWLLGYAGSLCNALKMFPNVKKVSTGATSAIGAVLRYARDNVTKIRKVLCHGNEVLHWQQIEPIIDLYVETGVKFYTSRPIHALLSSFLHWDANVATSHGYTWRPLCDTEPGYARDNRWSDMIRLHHPHVALEQNRNILTPEEWNVDIRVKTRLLSKEEGISLADEPPLEPLFANYALKKICIHQATDFQMASILQLAPNLSNVTMGLIRRCARVADDHRVFSYTPRNLQACMITTVREFSRVHKMIARDATNTMDFTILLHEAIECEARCKYALETLKQTLAFVKLQLFVTGAISTVPEFDALWNYIAGMPSLYSLELKSSPRGYPSVTLEEATELIRKRKEMRNLGTDMLTAVDTRYCSSDTAIDLIREEYPVSE